MRSPRAALLAVSVSVALAGTVLTGCASDQERYCEAVDERQQELTEIADAPGRDAIFRALPIYEDLAAEAPEDVADDWDVVVLRLQALQQAFDEAGVDPSTYDPKKPPADVDKGDEAAISEAAARLLEERTTTAMASVEQHSRDVCKTELGGAPLGG